MKPNTCIVNRALLQTTTSALNYYSESRLFAGSVTITNTSQQPIFGPLLVIVRAQMCGAILVNASGRRGGDPYIQMPLSPHGLLPGASITVPLAFRKRWWSGWLPIRFEIEARQAATGFTPELVSFPRAALSAPSLQSS